MARKTPEARARPAAVLASLSLCVQYACTGGAELPLRPQLRRWVRKTLDAADSRVESAQVTLRFVDADEGRQLNRQFRAKDYATNVLSFPYAPPPQLAGDLALCLPVVLAEAAVQGKTALAHFAHLVVHGMLHLQGYDHQTDNDAERMEARERQILARLGYADPY